MNIGFALCGSFCTYERVFPVMRQLAENHKVTPIFSRAAATLDSRFGTSAEFLARAEENAIALKQGVYMMFSGPSFETPAEVRMAGLLGGDAVGMSTACEAVAARHAGIRVCGISCISNLASGMSEKPLSHEEVQETANLVAARFTARLRLIVVRRAPDGGSSAFKAERSS